MKQLITITLSVILAFALASCATAGPKSLGKKPLCVGDDCSKEYPWLTNAKVREYQALEKALVGGGSKAIFEAASATGCFERLKNGKKNCYGVVSPANRSGEKRVWECYPLSPKEAPECYEAGE